MTTTLDASDAYAIRIEALRRVCEYGKVTNEIQGEICLFVSARLVNMEAAIRKEIADKQKEKQDFLRENSTIRQEIEADKNPPPEGATLVPSRIATREEQQNMILAIDKNYKFLFEQLAGLNNALDVIQEQQKALKDKLESTEERIKLLEESKK